MKRVITILICVALTLCLTVTAFAGGTVSTLTASATTEKVSVSGTTSGVTAAVTVQVLDGSSDILAMESFTVLSNSFSGELTGLSLTQGTAYTVRVADYDGGTWKTETVTVPKASSRSSGSAGTAAAGYTITSELKSITKVTVDGKTLDSKYYTVSGSNVILKQTYLNTLTAGKHTVKLYNGDKAATATITIKSNGTVKSAGTGDVGIALYACLLGTSVLGMGTLKRKFDNR